MPVQDFKGTLNGKAIGLVTSWTPTISADVPGDLSVVYTYQNGLYTKIGDTVNIAFFLITSSFTYTTASGGIKIVTLPFLANSVVVQPAGALRFSGLTKAGYTQFTVHPIQNSQTLVARASGSGIAAADVNITDFPSGGTVILISSLTYFT